MLLILICIIVLQCAILVGVVQLSNTPANLDRSAEAVFSNTVETSASAVEKRLTDMANLEQYESDVYKEISSLAKQNKVSVSEYVSRSDSGKKILDRVSAHILDCLRELGVVSSYIILENPDSETEKNALVLRDLNPGSVSANNHDILVEAGSSELMFEQGLTLDSWWTEKLSLDEDADFYYKPLRAGNQYQNISARDLGYYSRSYRLREHDILMVGYSRPLLDENHHAYGVIGVSYSLDYLQNMFADRGIGIDGDGSYFIGVTENETDYEMIVVQPGKYESKFEPGSVLSIGGKAAGAVNGRKDLYHILPGDGGELELAIYGCRLYRSNTPFEHERWVIGGMTDHTVLHQGSESLNRALKIALSVSAMICLISAMLLSEIMVRPIQLLLKGIGSFNRGSNLKLPRTGMREFDQLAQEIEHRAREVYRAGAKVSDIIHMADIRLGVLEFEKYSEYAFCNDRLLEMFELSIPGWQENYASREEVKKCMDLIQKRLKKEEEEDNIYFFRTSKGEEQWVSIKKVKDATSHLCVFLDVTDNIKEKQKIRHDRDYDVLTNLYNRRAFARIVRKMIEEGGCKNGVLSVWDLDHLKYINDTYGHDMGDQYICLLARVMSEFPVKNCIAARMSGDEFMVFFYDDTQENLYRYTKELHESFQGKKLRLPDGKQISVSVSAGMAFYNRDGNFYSQLVRYADFAMYEVKKNNKGNIRAFERDSYIQDYVLIHGIGELNRILEERSIRYAFQPIVDVQKKQVFAYEALLRPVSDMIKSPAELIRVAEKQSKLGVIEQITWFMAMESFFVGQEVQAEIKLFINSIPNQCLSDSDFSALEAQYGECFPRMVVEVTENARMDDQLESIKYDWCTDRGIALAMDDFGTGYSNTDILISRQFKYVKLDMSLIRNIHQSPDTQNLVSGIIEYCHKNGQKVISEGIENREELFALTALGTDYVQGYYLGKPEYTIQEKDYTELFQDS